MKAIKPILTIALVCCLLLGSCIGNQTQTQPEIVPLVSGSPLGLSVTRDETLGASSVRPLGVSVALGHSEPVLGYSDLSLDVSPSDAQAEESEEKVPEVIGDITPSLGASIAEKRGYNSDTVGWLKIPDTTVDTAVVRNPEGDNNYYTTHNFNKVLDPNGAYGTDFRCNLLGATRDTLQRNTTVYAHNLTEDPNGPLFAQLKKYKNPEFARTHPYVFFSTPQEDMVWEVFAVFDSNTDLPYIVPDLPWDIYSRILDVAYDASIHDYGIRVNPGDRILTLSTCSFVVPGRDPIPLNTTTRYRFVVMARLIDPSAPIRESVRITDNPDPTPPDSMPPIYHTGLDVFRHNGAIYATDPRWGLEADFSGAVEIGKILRTGICYDLTDGDATSLPVGAKLFGYPEWDDMIGVERDGEQIPYTKYLELAED